VEFRWNAWNLDHATRHGISSDESETLVRRGPARHIGENKYRVRGRGIGDRLIQVIYVIDQSESLYIIHARPLTDREKRQLRKRKP
jgi:uncharacterized DUF497 family protein